MLNRASFRSVLALSALALPGCMDDTSTIVPVPEPRLDDAAERTREKGPAHLTATVRAGRVRYRFDGRWDPTHGYRVCAAIEQAPLRYFARRVLWLEGQSSAYGTLTAHGRGCRRDSSVVRRPSPHPRPVRHRALPRRRGAPVRRTTCTRPCSHSTALSSPALLTETSAPCGRSRCHRAVIDFRAFDRDPPRRDEDGWTLRPLLRQLGTRAVEVRVGPGGLVERLRLQAPALSRRAPGPAEVELFLSRFGAGAASPARGRPRDRVARRARRGSRLRSRTPASGCGPRARPSPRAPRPWRPRCPSCPTRSRRRGPSSCRAAP